MCRDVSLSHCRIASCHNGANSFNTGCNILWTHGAIRVRTGGLGWLTGLALTENKFRRVFFCLFIRSYTSFVTPTESLLPLNVGIEQILSTIGDNPATTLEINLDLFRAGSSFPNSSTLVVLECIMPRKLARFIAFCLLGDSSNNDARPAGVFTDFLSVFKRSSSLFALIRVLYLLGFVVCNACYIACTNKIYLSVSIVTCFFKESHSVLSVITNDCASSHRDFAFSHRFSSSACLFFILTISLHNWIFSITTWRCCWICFESSSAHVLSDVSSGRVKIKENYFYLFTACSFSWRASLACLLSSRTYDIRHGGRVGMSD